MFNLLYKIYILYNYVYIISIIILKKDLKWNVFFYIMCGFNKIIMFFFILIKCGFNEII